jgi:hypothetical protein
VDVRVAQTCGLDTHQHPARSGLRLRYVLDDQRCPELMDDGGLHVNLLRR